MPMKITGYENIRSDDKILTEKELLQILKLLDKIMISFKKIPWENITVLIFNNWLGLLLFELELFSIMKADDVHSENYKNMLIVVFSKSFSFFLRGERHFQKMNITIVINIDGQKVPFRNSLQMGAIKRIKNCETIQDLIDASPTAECPVCKDVTFTESTPFVFRVSCNHLVCFSCQTQCIQHNNIGLVEKKYIFFFNRWMSLYKILSLS